MFLAIPSLGSAGEKLKRDRKVGGGEEEGGEDLEKR